MRRSINMTAQEIYNECCKHTVCANCSVGWVRCEKFASNYHANPPEMISYEDIERVKQDKEEY